MKIKPKMTANYPELYKKHFVEKSFDRLELFRIIRSKFKVKKGLYPGSFVHITPSLVIPEMVYVDTDERCKRFFEEKETRVFVNTKKEYRAEAVFRFHENNYNTELKEDLNSFDLLISLHAGFISRCCQKYLEKDGILIANNSHGDAPLAFLDKRFDFVGVVNRRGVKFTYNNDNLESYFIPKSGTKLNKREIEKTMRGPAYTKTAYVYVFRKKK